MGSKTKDLDFNEFLVGVVENCHERAIELQ